MLERSYESTAAHVDKPVTAEDSSVLRVENYQELVSAVLYLVTQCQEEGAIQLYDYQGDVERDLTDACLEVAKEDPWGPTPWTTSSTSTPGWCPITRPPCPSATGAPQSRCGSIVNVTGASAIRDQLQDALAAFSSEVVLRVAYFAEDEASIAQLIRQAYYDTPVAALGMPRSEITLYPDSGSQRVVEILLTYPEESEALWRKSDLLSAQAGTISAAFRGLDARSTALRAASEAAGLRRL